MRAKGLWMMPVLLLGVWALWRHVEAADEARDTPWARAAVAIDHGAVYALRRELRAGLDPDSAEAGTSLLMMAAWTGNAEAAAALLEAGASADRPSGAGITPLMGAAQTGDEPTMRQLLNAGADVDAASDAGWTALLFAAGSGDPRRVRLLLDAGADAGCRTSAGTSAADIAEQNGHADVLRVLTQK